MAYPSWWPTCRADDGPAVVWEKDAGGCLGFSSTIDPTTIYLPALGLLSHFLFSCSLLLCCTWCRANSPADQTNSAHLCAYSWMWLDKNRQPFWPSSHLKQYHLHLVLLWSHSSVFIPIPKKGNVKECSNYRTIALISHASKVMLKILQARLQQYMNCERSDIQAGFRKGRGTRDQIANIQWIIQKAREFQKNIYFCFIDYAKACDCVDHNTLWKILKQMGVPDHFTCLLRNLYAG